MCFQSFSIVTPGSQVATPVAFEGEQAVHAREVDHDAAGPARRVAVAVAGAAQRQRNALGARPLEERADLLDAGRPLDARQPAHRHAPTLDVLVRSG